MVQTKYNRKIYDAANEKTLFIYSHLRANAISPLHVKEGERILVMEPDSVALLEYLIELKAIVTAVDIPKELKEEALHTGIIEAGLKLVAFDELKGDFDTVIMMGQQSHPPMMVKKYMAEKGRLSLIFSGEQIREEYVRELLLATGFLHIEEYILTPDYKYTTEIFSADYEKKPEGDYLIIAS